MERGEADRDPAPPPRAEEGGSPGRTRTSDLVVNSHPLYQLSYRGSHSARLIADARGDGQRRPTAAPDRPPSSVRGTWRIRRPEQRPAKIGALQWAFGFIALPILAMAARLFGVV